MKRKIIHIDEALCNGCGACAQACHEEAIGMVNGKAKLLREDFCDGLGDCLPACPAGAIAFETREAPAYDEQAVRRAKGGAQPAGGCPGTRLRTLAARQDAGAPAQAAAESRLAQWPCQLKLIPAGAPYFEGARLLIAADCTAYAYARLHEEFMRGKITLIGCPKLDSVDYSEKLGQILSQHEIKSITLVRMEVPCCGGLEFAAKKAIEESGRQLPLRVVTFSIEGEILADEA